MEDEIAALNKNNTWEKCVLLEGKKTVGCKWVFSIKCHVDRTIERNKARLVVKGYTQTYEIIQQLSLQLQKLILSEFYSQ